MRTTPHVRTLRASLGIALALLLCGGLLLASDPPDSEINQVTGYIETVDSTPYGLQYDIRHVVDPGNGEPLNIKRLTSDLADDISARIAIDSAGDTWVAWTRSGVPDKVFVRHHDYAQSDWDGETLVGGNPLEGGRNPEIAIHAGEAWIAYEYDAGGVDTGIGVSSTTEEPDPWSHRHQLGTTDFTGDVDSRIHADAGSLWITWVDDADDVAWSVYDEASSTWDAPLYESYAADSVADARSRIRDSVLGN